MLTEVLDFLRDIQAILGVIVGGLGGAWLQSRSATKALEHGADEARKQREHENSQRREDIERTERLRQREELRAAHAACAGALASLIRYHREQSPRPLVQLSGEVDAAVAVVRMLSTREIGSLATKANGAAVDVVNARTRRKRSGEIQPGPGPDPLMEEAAERWSRYIEAAAAELAELAAIPNEIQTRSED